ncbi:MAG: hypothetical protein COB22_00120 [Cycloclasticus sp.]|nr:MAG: hypothetical protein COB22_00120 [Cycloclasticus sp.]
MSSSSSLYRYIFHGTRLNVTPEERKSLVAIGLDNTHAWSSFAEGQILSRGTTTCLKVTLPHDGDVIYFKRYKYTKNPWEFFLRRSKAANEAINYQRFKKIGIPTLDIIALYEQRSLGLLHLACIITKELKNTTQLNHFYTDILLKMPKDEQQKVFKELKEKLFQQIRLAHHEGVFHLDLKWRNIMVQQEGDQYTPIWIDCPRGVHRRFFNYSLKVADLSGLARKALLFFSSQQLYRMLYLYLGENATKKEARQLFYDIKKHLERRPPKVWRN